MSWRAQVSAKAQPEDREISRTVAVLGGARVLKRSVRNRFEAHDLIAGGLRAGAIHHLVRNLVLLSSHDNLEKVLGISGRTYQRHKAKPEKRLSADQSSRAWKFAEILGRATDIFGSRQKAEEWLERPAMALNRRKPIDLLSTTAGVESLEELLTRMEYGVYT
jgi:putative toxin-antitoxin system antitoxin component (TIGR02293 family)